MGRTKLENFSVEEVKKIVLESCSIAEVIRKLGYETIQGDNYKTLKRYFKKHNIDISHFAFSYAYIKGNPKWVNPEDILINPCPTTRNIVRKFILRNNILEYKCSFCGNNGNWIGKTLSLELDHIDGNEENSEISNLRWLCPNCHAITDTFGGKNVRIRKEKRQQEENNRKKEKKKNYCCSCGKEIHKNKTGLCQNCYKETLRKVERPSREKLKILIRENSFSQIGKQYFVSDKTICKWCIYYNLPSKKKEINSYTDEEWELI